MTTKEFDPTAVDLSEERVNAILDELVAEKGADYVYARSATGHYTEGTCVNAELDEQGNVQPSCIVGHVLARVGVPLDLLMEYDTFNSGGLLNELRLNPPSVVRDLLRVVQSNQDVAVPWGMAVDRAREEVANYYTEEGEL